MTKNRYGKGKYLGRAKSLCKWSLPETHFEVPEDGWIRAFVATSVSVEL